MPDWLLVGLAGYNVLGGALLVYLAWRGPQRRRWGERALRMIQAAAGLYIIGVYVMTLLAPGPVAATAGRPSIALLVSLLAAREMLDRVRRNGGKHGGG